MEVDREFLEPGADAAAFLEPADALLDDRATAVRLLVELDFGIVPRLLVVLVRDHRRDAPPRLRPRA